MNEFIIAVLLGIAVIALFLIEENRLCKAQAEAAANKENADFEAEYKEKYRLKWREALAENERLEAEIRALKNAESEGVKND